MNYSLIIPFFNEEKNIQSLLNNLFVSLNNLNNENRNFQIIFVDDGSKDSTFEKLKIYSDKKFKTIDIKGLKFNPITKKWKKSNDLSVNYIICSSKI